MSTEHIAAQFMALAPALVGLNHSPFGREACLTFRGDSRRGGDSSRRCTMMLTSIHLWATRQINLGRHDSLPINAGQWEDWFVHNFAILKSSDFLTGFMAKSLGFASDLKLYDMAGNSMDSSQFSEPCHVQFVLGGGHLDVICENIGFTDLT